MSGICGIVALGSSPPSRGELERILMPLERRGPDRRGIWSGRTAVLGHALLATTPEAEKEHLPLTRDRLTITADARIDNREELLAELGWDETSRGGIGDGELILHCYLRWGETCLDHLLGDFAFAIWDEEREELFCARDQIGMRQLTYCHLTGKLFLFSTEPLTLLNHPAVPRDFNETRIAEFLEDLEGVDTSSTFFSSISRLPPAHFLVANRDGLKVRRYWTLEAPPLLRLPSRKAYEEALVDVLQEAIGCRLRSAGPVGSMLSGGMDSGSVAALAARLLQESGRGPLRTFSAISPDPERCVETRAILASAKLDGLDPVFVSHADLRSLRRELEEQARDLDDPFDGNMTLIRAVYLAAHRSNVKIMLDGVGGDVVFSSGNCVAQLLREKRLGEAWAEAKGESAFWGAHWSSWRILAEAAWVVLVPGWIRRARQAWLDHVGGGSPSLISASFSKRVGLRSRRRAQRRLNPDSLTDPASRARIVEHPNLTVARERYDRVAGASAIEARDPFLDLRVIRFCLSLPWPMLQRDGWPKTILRHSMTGLMPEGVIWRRGKDHLGWAFTEELMSSRRQLPALRSDLSVRLLRWVRPDVISDLGAGTGSGAARLSPVYHLTVWLARISRMVETPGIE